VMLKGRTSASENPVRREKGKTNVVADNSAGDLVLVGLSDAEVVGVSGAADGVAVSGGSASSELGVEGVLHEGNSSGSVNARRKAR
jgi:hypothetical protein